MNTDTKRDDFDFGDEPTPVPVTIRGKTKIFHFHDISKDEFDALYEPVNSATGDPEALAKANKELIPRAVALVVRQVDGTRISEADARQMRVQLINKLAMKVMAFFTNGDVDTAGEEKLGDKPEVEEEKKD